MSSAATVRTAAGPARAAGAPRACAAAVLEAVPALMREIRGEMRRAAPAGLSVPAFRTLIFARTQPGGSISALAAHLGVSVPTASVAVDKLVQRGLLRSTAAAGNRRQRELHLTAEGAQIVSQALSRTTDAFAALLAGIDPGDLQDCMAALQLLAGRIAARSREASPITP